MKRIKCIVIDDEQASIEILRRMIRKVPELIPVGFTTDPIKGLEMVRNLNVELAFVDLHMPDMHGLDLIRELGDQVQVICCSALIDYGPQLFELDVIYYLTKPFSLEKFQKAVFRALERTRFAEWAGNQYAALKYDPEELVPFKDQETKNLMFIPISEIDYIQGADHCVQVFHHAGEKTNVISTMRDIEALLPASHFMRVHKSFIVAVNRIWLYNKGGHSITLRPTCKPVGEIPLGKMYEDIVNHFIDEKIKRLANVSKLL